MANSDRAATGIPPRVQEKGVWSESATYEFSTTAADTVVEMIKVAAGTTVLDGYIIYDDLGAGLTADVGDGNDIDRYIDGANTATAAALTRFGVGAGGLTFPYTYTADDTIDVKNLGGNATGTLTLTVFFTREEVDLS